MAADGGGTDSARAGAGPSRGGAWAIGVALVLLGVVFLLRNVGLLAVPLPDNWWAIFILIPAAIAAGTALTAYRAAGQRLTAAARSALATALVLTTVAAMFLFGLDWGVFWPLLLIAAGLGAVLNWETLAGRGRHG